MTLKLLLLTILCVLSLGNIASAEWEGIGETRNGTNDFTIYVDRSTIRKAGNSMKMWTIQDYTSTQTSTDGRPFLFAMAQEEYDCYIKKLRDLGHHQYSGQMGKGISIHSHTDENAQWAAIVPGSAGETLWKIACGKQ